MPIPSAETCRFVYSQWKCCLLTDFICAYLVDWQNGMTSSKINNTFQLMNVRFVWHIHTNVKGKSTASNFSAEVLWNFMWNFGTWHTTSSDVQECNNHVRENLTPQSTNFVNAKQRIYRRKCGSKIHKSNHLREYFKRRSPSTIFMLTSQLEWRISCVICSCRVITHSPVRSQVLYRKVDYCPEFVLTC